MSSLVLCTGPFEVPGHRVARSGIRWLCSDGHSCRAGELIAYCNIALMPLARDQPRPFAEEALDFQIVFAAPASGILRRSEAQKGGFLDRQNAYNWTNFVLGAIEGAAELPGGGIPVPPLLMVAGRRMTPIANEHHGLLTGWHGRTRVWWGDALAAPGTLVAMGTCELEAMLRGGGAAFQELFDSVPGPAQAIVIQDEPLVLCAPVIAEQLTRTPADREAIATDIIRGFAAGPHAPGPADWFFIGALQAALDRSPLTDDGPILTRNRLVPAGPPRALLHSLAAEIPRIARHRRLGYAIAVHDHRLATLGPASAHWLRTQFEPIRRSVDDIRRDYEMLITAVRERTGACVLSINIVSKRMDERIHSYAGFQAPLADRVSSIRASELNLMLTDVARSHGVAVIDADAISADLGLFPHVPDGVHASGTFHAAVRSETVRMLAERGVPGFGSRG